MAVKEQSPFVNFSIEQVLKAEQNSFIIQLGDDMFSYDGKYVFTQKSAESFKNEIEIKLSNAIKNGTLKDQKLARYKLFNLRIYPMRLH
jgi:hypothetical protein